MSSFDLVVDQAVRPPLSIRKFLKWNSYQELVKKFGPFLGLKNNKLFFLIPNQNTQRGFKWHEVTDWTKNGQPTVYIHPIDLHYEITDGSFMNFFDYRDKRDLRRPVNIKKLTHSQPITGHLFWGSESHRPQIEVDMGHHRFNAARTHQGGTVGIYVTLLDVKFEEPIDYGMTWEQAVRFVKHRGADDHSLKFTPKLNFYPW